MGPVVSPEAPTTFGVDGLRLLFEAVARRGYRILGPQIVDGVVDIEPMDDINQLPVGWGDEQAPGSYRLRRRDDHARFGYAVGPNAWKRIVHPPTASVWTMRRDANGELDISMHRPDPPPAAFFGVRPCELAAIGRLDTVLLTGEHASPVYEANRRDTLLITVNCGAPAATCFCSSMGTGPEAGDGADIVLTELLDQDEVRYVATAESSPGAEILVEVDGASASPEDLLAVRSTIDQAERTMTRTASPSIDFDVADIQRWSAVGERCLACGNCTAVCPTCFCTNPVDTTDLSGGRSDRLRTWDTCFSTAFSHMGDGPVRASTASRYRQWISHKLSTWVDQFGESGCVGCGRCITWCPVGIDITAEAASHREGAP